MEWAIWVIGYVVVWILFSGWLASDNARDIEAVAKAMCAGLCWPALVPLIILLKLIGVVAMIFKKIGL